MSEAVTATGILVQRSPVAQKVVSSSVAAATVITTVEPHGYESGDVVNIAGHTGSTPVLAGPYTVTKISPTTFSVPVNVSVAGTGGTVTPVEAFTTIGEIVSVSPPGFSRNKIDVTSMNEGAEASVLGILRQKDGGFRINLIGTLANHAEVINDVLYNVKASWRFVYPSGVKWTGPGRVQRFEMVDAPVDAAQQADVSIAWSGAVTYAAT
jgi:hypothetical protein